MIDLEFLRSSKTVSQPITIEKRALVCNSGTSALFGAFEGLRLGPGDEVIVPAYTFFATASPLMYLGVTRVFCDCDDDGNVRSECLPALLNRAHEGRCRYSHVGHALRHA